MQSTRKAKSSLTLLGLGFCCFLIAQALPAIQPDMGAWSNPASSPLPGWFITAVAWPFYLSNAFLLLAPALVFLLKRMKRARTLMGCLTIWYVLTPFGALACKNAILAVGPGCHFWVASCLLCAIGTAMAMPPRSKQA